MEENTPDIFSQGVTTLESQIAEKFPKEFVQTLKVISHEIATIGLNEEEACLIAHFPYDEFKKKKDKEPLIAKLIKLKNLTYERNLLKGLTSRAMNDDKLSQWLLERKAPEKYNQRKGTGETDSTKTSMLTEAVKFVRTHQAGMVKKESGSAFLVKSASGADIKSLKDILN